ncbi:hypothetical protein [Armatimonas sp.]|uniref:hypothetical protein n=1 Tax=Armatimonas sp. TaxID=1872638 RepID=UPI003753ABB0
MITNIPGPVYGQLAFALANVEGLTKEHLETLRSEITADPSGRGYAGKSAQQIHLLLHNPYSQSVGESWIPKPVVSGVELKNWIAPLKLSVRLSTASLEVKGAWLGIMGDFQGVSDSYLFNPAASEQWQGLVAQLPSLVDAAKARIITDDHLQALTHTYRPTSVEMAKPRVEVILGVGIALTLDEVKGLI